MLPLETSRLRIEDLTEEDAGFTLALLNDPAFIEHVGDRQVRDEEQARQYLLDGPLRSYREHGFGMYALRLKSSGEAVGMCGLVKRPSLEDVDIGYALLPGFRGDGYALEAAQRVMQWALDELGLQRLVAIVSPQNHASRKLLAQLGMHHQGMVRLADDDQSICLYGLAEQA